MTMTRSEFLTAPPDVFFLDDEAPEPLQGYLRRADVIPQTDSISGLEKAGDGNMNCTLRVTTGANETLIVKLLLDHGADPNDRSNDGYNCLLTAVESEWPE